MEGQTKMLTALPLDPWTVLKRTNVGVVREESVRTGAKVYLDALTHINGRQCVRAKDVETNGDNVKEMKGLALDICEETFPGVKNPKGEVERGFRFWDCVSTLDSDFLLC